MTRWATHSSRVSRARRRLADTIELTLHPGMAARRGLLYWPRIKPANRAAVEEPLGEIVTLLRDPAIPISEAALPRILTLVTHPASPVYGSYPTQALYVAWSLADELRAPTLSRTA